MFFYNQDADSFLNAFDEAWNDKLSCLGLRQSQMISGQRLRPYLVWWGFTLAKRSFKLGENEIADVVKVAICIEMIHKSSIILDDWIDDDSARHGKASFHIENGPHKTAMSSILMLSQAMNDIVLAPMDHAKQLHSLGIITETLCKMSQGQMMELNLSQITCFKIDTIKEIIDFETGTLLANSLLLGYTVAGGDSSNTDYLLKVGYKCGYIFQVLNDLESFANDEKNAQHKGQANYDSDRERKNIAIALLHSVAKENDAAKISFMSFDEIKELILRYDIIDFFLSEVRITKSSIIDIINSDFFLADPEWKNEFLLFFEFLVQKCLDRLS